VLLVPDAMNRDQAGTGQPRELAMNGARAALGEPDQLAPAESAVRLCEQQAENPLLDGSEESIGDPGSSIRSQIGNDHTRFGNGSIRRVNASNA
jgi:hypothetical protein